jgi:hypothetical protein
MTSIQSKGVKESKLTSKNLMVFSELLIIIYTIIYVNMIIQDENRGLHEIFISSLQFESSYNIDLPIFCEAGRSTSSLDRTLSPWRLNSSEGQVV